MNENALQNKDKKFFFDINIFDEREEPTEPPPPMFSESELEAARQKAAAEGKRAGIHETEAARAKHIAKTLDQIAANISVIAAAEGEREKRYEREAVALCLATFQKLYPAFEKNFGFEEMKKILETILRAQEGQKQIMVYVAPAVTEGVTRYLSELRVAGAAINFSVHGEETMAEGSCRLAWSDGGAVRDAQALALAVEKALKDLLAVNAPKVHD